MVQMMQSLLLIGMLFGPNRLSSALACKPPHPGLYAPASSSPLLFFQWKLYLILKHLASDKQNVFCIQDQSIDLQLHFLANFGYFLPTRISLDINFEKNSQRILSGSNLNNKPQLKQVQNILDILDRAFCRSSYEKSFEDSKKNLLAGKHITDIISKLSILFLSMEKNS
ncbi:hypothetical protein BpHYR1_047535 [Brachionus plicatilis]|uniref:Uncharacterized protein n=1 Tax=Brachionus plicatilis TaxID=10195 RepID=A0A3M7QUB8_BRAPC|nr:hypothetical protein BpHYR1_047535 [Brachionus plicatilis]